MGSDWQKTRLGELISVTHGYAFKGDDFSEANVEGPIVVTIGNFDYTGGFRFESTKIKRCNSEYPAEYELMPGDILLVMTCQTEGGEILGIPGIISDDNEIYLHNQRIGKVIIKSREVSSKYLYWLFLSRDFNLQLCATATGTKILHTAPKRIENFLFDCPPLSEQKAIAHILGSLDDKIELNRRMNTTLEGMAQALFKSWFVDFDPVIDNALVAGNPIPEELAERAEVRRRVLDDGSANREAAKAFPAAFQLTEEIGWIPEGWETQSLYDTANFINGASFRGTDFTDDPGALPVVKIAEIKNGITGQTKFTNIIKDEKYRISDGEILLSWSGNPDTSIDTFVWTDGEGWLNQHIFKVSLKNGVTRFFVYYQLKYLRSVFAEIARDKQTTGLGHFTGADMKRLIIFKPSTKLLTVFNNAAASLYQRCYQNRLTEKSLSNLRDTLLPKLISGELRIPEAEKLTEEALA